jgi:deoxyribonuclease V
MLGVQARALHPWRVSYEEALAIQRLRREQVRIEPLRRTPRLVAGADVAYSRATHRMYASVVVVALPSLEIVAEAHAARRARFPYIPGLFSFRELPPLIAAFERLVTTPDVLLFDGQGLAHPRRFGLACHAGVIFDRPSVGCAKSLLVGRHATLGPARGSVAELIHEGEVVGLALRTRAGVKPVYVSVGHRVDAASAAALVLACTRRYRLPEPLRLAHQQTTALMRRLDARARRVAQTTYPDFLKPPPS